MERPATITPIEIPQKIEEIQLQGTRFQKYIIKGNIELGELAHAEVVFV